MSAFEESFRKPRVLLAEDSGELLNIYAHFLKREGLEFFLTSSATEALEVFNKFATEISIVLTDGEMPGPNGLWLAERIKNVSPNVPIILLTGNPALYLEAKNRELFAEVVEKPLAPPTLKRILRNHLAKPTGAPIRPAK